MATRINLKHDAETRAKIQTSQLINRLQSHANGEVEMTSTQVRAAEVLLKKAVPDLQAITHSGDEESGPIKLETVMRWMREGE